jgi:hypothetical protein
MPVILASQEAEIMVQSHLQANSSKKPVTKIGLAE